MDELEILDDAALAQRWFFDKIEGITQEAIAKRIDRISDKKRAGHLKSRKAGNKRIFRIEDVREFEARTKNSVVWFAQAEFTDDDLAEMFDEHGNLT